MKDYKVVDKIGDTYIIKYPATDNTFEVKLVETTIPYWGEMRKAYDRKKKLEKLLS